MTKSDVVSIERTIELKASPDRVWKAITDPSELAQWFPDEAEFDAQVGSMGRFTWVDHGAPRIRVEAVDAPRFLAWSWESPDGRPLEEYSTRVEWTLDERPDGGTTLTVRESGFDNPDHVKMNTHGWTEELAQLVEFLGSSA